MDEATSNVFPAVVGAKSPEAVARGAYARWLLIRGVEEGIFCNNCVRWSRLEGGGAISVFASAGCEFPRRASSLCFLVSCSQRGREPPTCFSSLCFHYVYISKGDKYNAGAWNKNKIENCMLQITLFYECCNGTELPEADSRRETTGDNGRRTGDGRETEGQKRSISTYNSRNRRRRQNRARKIFEKNS